MSSPTTAPTEGAATTTTTGEVSLLDKMLDTGRWEKEGPSRDRGVAALDTFIGEIAKGQIVSKDVETNIKYWISSIDKKLTAQLNEVMHDPAFQKMEGTWRGLHYLIMNSETGEQLKIRVMNCTK